MQIVIDMDGTICTEMRQFSRCLAKPKADAVTVINELYDAGNTIIIYSARTWVEYEMTVDWLKRYGVKYHQLFMGKPIGDVWIDDRAITVKENWKEIGEQLKNKKK
jgi:uncharacterized HAD superfamily protein